MVTATRLSYAQNGTKDGVGSFRGRVYSTRWGRFVSSRLRVVIHSVREGVQKALKELF